MLELRHTGATNKFEFASIISVLQLCVPTAAYVEKSTLMLQKLVAKDIDVGLTMSSTTCLWILILLLERTAGKRC